MRKFLISVLVITVASIIYIYQQARLLEYSYIINTNQKYISLLVDRNRELRYNVARLEAPTRLEDIMLAKEDRQAYSFDRWYKIQVGREEVLPSHKVVTTGGSFIKTGKTLLRMFSLDTEAVAKELNNQE